MRTWVVELWAVACILAAVATLRGGAVEWIGAGAVLLSFAHGQVADRLAEQQARMVAPDVECHRWTTRYFVGKEALWVVYFVAHQSWSALVGCGVFLVYPVWRRWYRRRVPC